MCKQIGNSYQSYNSVTFAKLISAFWLKVSLLKIMLYSWRNTMDMQKIKELEHQLETAKLLTKNACRASGEQGRRLAEQYELEEKLTAAKAELEAKKSLSKRKLNKRRHSTALDHPSWAPDFKHKEDRPEKTLQETERTQRAHDEAMSNIRKILSN